MIRAKFVIYHFLNCTRTCACTWDSKLVKAKDKGIKSLSKPPKRVKLPLGLKTWLKSCSS